MKTHSGVLTLELTVRVQCQRCTIAVILLVNVITQMSIKSSISGPDTQLPHSIKKRNKNGQCIISPHDRLTHQRTRGASINEIF